MALPYKGLGPELLALAEKVEARAAAEAEITLSREETKAILAYAFRDISTKYQDPRKLLPLPESYIIPASIISLQAQLDAGLFSNFPGWTFTNHHTLIFLDPPDLSAITRDVARGS